MKELSERNEGQVPRNSITREILRDAPQEENEQAALYARQLLSEAHKDQEGMIEAAHMTKGGLYVPDVDLYQPKEEQRPDPEEVPEPDASGRPMPRSLSSKSRGGEFGTPKFKEILKIKNFKQKITELFKSKRRSDIQD